MISNFETLRLGTQFDRLGGALSWFPSTTPQPAPCPASPPTSPDPGSQSAASSGSGARTHGAPRAKGSQRACYATGGQDKTGGGEMATVK